MKCEKCSAVIEDNESHEFHGRTICEDCYIDALSPAKACDPWAVYSAKSFSTSEGEGNKITATQSKILQILKETGGAEPRIISERLQMDLSDLEREIATLRHMEKLRAERREGKKIIRLW
jgi:hypothetical protein